MIKCTFEKGYEASLRHVVVDTLVVKDKQILLVKRAATLSEGGKWGIIGGYMERDETTKQTAMREVMEETGYTIKDITLLTIRDNPDRPSEDRQNVAFVYFCTAVEKVGEHDWEVDELRWFDFSNLPSKKEVAFDHYQNIELYLECLNQGLQLPVLE